jgi:hypothetical protein
MAIVARQREAMPILIVELRMIGAIIISGTARFRPKQSVLGDAFRSQHPVMKLPSALQLVQALGAEMGEVPHDASASARSKARTASFTAISGGSKGRGIRGEAG